MDHGKPVSIQKTELTGGKKKTHPTSSTKQHLPTAPAAPVPPLKVSRMKRKTNWRAAHGCDDTWDTWGSPELQLRSPSHDILTVSPSKYVDDKKKLRKKMGAPGRMLLGYIVTDARYQVAVVALDGAMLLEATKAKKTQTKRIE